MVLKRCLSLTLSIAIATSVTAPVGPALAQSGANSEDPVVLILSAMKAGSKAEAQALIARAKSRLAQEKLPPESLRRIETLLSTATERLNVPSQPRFASQTGGSQPITFAADPATRPTALASETEELQKLLSENPALRDSMREIGKGRLSRDADTLPAIIQSRTNMALADHDKREAGQAATLDSPSAFVASLRTMGLIIKNAPEVNRALRERYDSLPTDVLADHIVGESIRNGAAAGAIKEILGLMKDSPFFKTREFAGVSIEALSTFIINANMVLRLTDLYGVKLTSANEDVLILAIFATSKFAMHYGLKSPSVQQTAKRMGSLFVDATKVGTAAGIMKYVELVLGNPVVARVLRGTPGSDFIGPQRPADAVPQAAPRSRREAVLRLAASVAWSAGETMIVGQAAKLYLRGAQDRERALANESFRRYLMSSKGEGFIKILILAMNTGRNNPNVVDVLKATDSKSAFILNTARSTRVCSSQDLARFRTLSANASLATVEGAKTLAAQDYRILKFACDSGLSSGRYDRMVKEFATFNEIPQTLVAGLRLAGYQNRVRMGEVLMQLQFLDGDRDPEELEFFEDAISKILGFENLEDSKYFDRMEAFIRERGGMVRSAASPTGYAIGAISSENPYDLTNGYTATRGPDAPQRSESASQ